MNRQWTDDQMAAISLQNRGLLVSAAAGSGKTAVLVERIIRRVTAADHPMDVDRLLVVTFTKAAASEMKERIRDALEKEAEAHPDNARLREQLALVPYAKITTIDSFCHKIVADHFQMIPGLDPGFRTADEGECEMIMNEVMEELLEEKYASIEENKGFQSLVDIFPGTKVNARISELVKQLYVFSSSDPYPIEWLNRCRDLYQYGPDDREQFDRLPIFDFVAQDFYGTMDGLVETYEYLINLCKDSRAPENLLNNAKPEKTLYKDLEGLREICDIAKEKGFREGISALGEFKLISRPQTRFAKNEYDDIYTSALVEFRESFNEKLKKTKKYFSSVSPEALLQETQIIRPYLNGLIDLTLEFEQKYSAAKRKKNLVDFSDVEHFVLQILIREHGEKPEDIVLSDVAREISDSFDEVMVDEYQDSNLVQEYLLLAVSKELQGNPNLFMVGDVKQSIYAFRMARPQLFMAKYDSFPVDDGVTDLSGAHQKIELSRNFRSRTTVLDACNFMFRHIMLKNLGGVEYNDENALYAGAVFPEYPEALTNIQSPETELLLMEILPDTVSMGPGNEENRANEVNGEEDEASDDEADENPKEEGAFVTLEKIDWEARLVAEKIRSMMSDEHPFLVRSDEGEGKYRKVDYKDILIVLRAAKDWAEGFVKVLAEYDIPAVCDSKTGYFESYEVRIILNMLRIIDNPKQDIPVISILNSPVFGMKLEELTKIRLFARSGETVTEEGKKRHFDFYYALKYYADYFNHDVDKRLTGTEEERVTLQKVNAFLKFVEKYRLLRKTMGIHDLINELLKDSGLELMVGSMYSGELRQANLSVLLKLALDYEKTSYTGLYHFLKYIELMKENDVDLTGSVSLAQDGNVVRILTIHKSKGLEYPVVFVSGLTKNFGNMDIMKPCALEQNSGIAMEAIDSERRTILSSGLKKVFNKKKTNDNLGEELRILYVAMTRAKEKLILTGADKEMQKKCTAAAMVSERSEERLSYFDRTNAKCYLDWVLPVAMLENSNIKITRMTNDELIEKRVREAIKDVERIQQRKMVEEFGKKFHLSKDEAGEWYNAADRAYSFVYPYLDELERKANLSVSELKKAAIEKMNELLEEEQKEQIIFGTEIEEAEIPVPKFMKTDETHLSDGAKRGSAYHEYMEKLDFTHMDLDNATVVENLCKGLDEEGKITEEYQGLVNYRDLALFFSSELGKRMCEAAKDKKLFKEQSFILGLTPKQIDEAGCLNPDEVKLPVLSDARNGDSFCMIQGIIDGYFMEGDDIILMDYKTDRVSAEHGEEELKERYYTQMYYYDLALRRMTGKNVKEWWIYSFSLKRPVLLFHTQIN